jgi:maleate cis-trans isomerase
MTQPAQAADIARSVAVGSKQIDFGKRYGWRAKIGLISPALLDTSAEQMRKILPEGVLLSAVTISMPIQQLGTEQGTRAFELMIEGGKRLAAEKMDVLICGGAAVAVMKGVDGDREMEQALRRETGLPLVMANGGILEALRYLNARSVVAISPFIEPRNREIEDFLNASGYRCLAAEGLGLTKNVDFASQPPQAALDLGLRTLRAHPDADALYIACPRWPTVDIIETLERETGKPVISAPAAWIWGALRALGIRDCSPGYGRLLDELRAGR